LKAGSPAPEFPPKIPSSWVSGLCYLMEPPLVDVGIQRNVTRIIQNPSDFPDREPVTQQSFDPHEVLIKLAFLQGALGLSQHLTPRSFS